MLTAGAMQVVDAPEILTIISSIPHLEPFLNCFYSCRYADFLQVCSRACVGLATAVQHRHQRQSHTLTSQIAILALYVTLYGKGSLRARGAASNHRTCAVCEE